MVSEINVQLSLCRRTTVSAFAQFVSWFVEFCIYTVIMASHMMSEDVTLTNSG